LQQIDFSSNLLSYDSIVALSRGLILNKPINPHKKSIENINLSRNRIGPESLQILCKSLEEHSGIKILNVSHNIIGNAGVITVGKLVQKLMKCGIKHKLNFGLKELYLNSNKISSDGAIPFFNSLTAC
jgi:Ran GTPase-activating protein (RanGAP) involved in mRNA processing and transport